MTRVRAGLGAKPPGKQNVAGAAKAKISDAEGDAYRKAQLGALSPFPLPLCVIYTILLVLRGREWLRTQVTRRTHHEHAA